MPETSDYKMQRKRKKTHDKEGLYFPTRKPSTLPFILRNVFKNVSRLSDGCSTYSEIEEHFGVPWSIGIIHKANYFGVALHCERPDDDKWNIETCFDVELSSKNGISVQKSFKCMFTKPIGFGNSRFLGWDKVLEICSNDDEMSIEVHVTIINMTGIYKDKLRNFDASTENFADGVLIVQNEKFYILRKYLAAQSSYFNALFFGGFHESKQTQVILSGIRTGDFQNYLEVLYGEPAIDDVTVEGILLLADMYETKVVIRKCATFLIEKSKKTLKKKLQMSVRCNLEDLKTQCISQIKTKEDIRSLKENDDDWDPSITEALLQISRTLK